jgi:arylsulfatase A-like enzyme
MMVHALLSLASCNKFFHIADLKGWNVVLITIDAVDPKKLGCYGGKKITTPFLDSLAQEGLLIEHAYCPTGSTAQSHASMLTSLFPEHHGCYVNGDRIDPGTWNLPTSLLAQGYDTIAWTRAWFMSRENNFARGFKHFFVRPYNNSANEKACKDSNYNDFEQIRTFFVNSHISSPFFAWFHLKGGHAPLVPIHPKYLKRYRLTMSSEKLPQPPANLDMNLAYLSSDSPIKNDSPYLAQLREYYDCNLSEMDDALRSLIGLFHLEGKLRNTLFLIVADHGETFENGIIGQHAPSPYESTMQIPIILWTEDRDIFRGKRIKDRIVSITDIAPTLLSVLGFRDVFPKELDGIDFFDKTSKRYTLQGSFGCTYLYEYAISKWKQLQMTKDKTKEDAQTLWNIAKKIEADDWSFYVQYRYDPLSRILMKLIYTQSGPYKFHIPPQMQLYNLAHNPYEQVDLLRTSSSLNNIGLEMFHELKRARPLAGWTTSMIKSPIDLPNLPVKTEFPNKRLELDQKTIERLKSLGYLR